MTGRPQSAAETGSRRRTLQFVNARADALRVRRADVDVVVLDTGWTPDPGEPAGPTPIRPTLLDVLDEVDTFRDSLRLLDAWAEAAGLADRFTMSGVTWWFHARSFLRLDLQELIIWSSVLDRLAPAGRYDAIVVPDDRPLLAAAARAGQPSGGPAVKTVGGSSYTSSDASGRPVTRTIARDRPSDRAIRSARRLARWTLIRLNLRTVPPDKAALIRERLATLAAGDPPIMSVVRAASFHHVANEERLERRDPYVGPVTARLVDEGRQTVTVGLSLILRRPEDWEQVCADPRLLPAAALYMDPDAAEEESAAADAAEAERRVRGLPAIPLLIGARDVAPVLSSAVGELGPWLLRQRREMVGARALMGRLRPPALLTAWEAARTAWLAAARDLGIPSIVIEHGVIYPDTPDYCRPEHPALVRPDVTCVYGEYERGILTGQGGYAPEAVVATGSPRVDHNGFASGITEAERSSVRAELGIADGDRALVISGGRMTVGDRLGTLPLLARVLDGALPGVHLVIKIHPEEQGGDHYRAMIDGLARAGGYAPPRLTVVRDIDLYRLLRAADAHLGVYSTVLTDAVLTGTPNMIVVGQALGDLLGYVAAGVAAPIRSVADVRAFMADPQRPAVEARRQFVEAHYRAGDAVGRIAGLVVDLANGRSQHESVASTDTRQPTPAPAVRGQVQRGAASEASASGARGSGVTDGG